MFVERKNYNGVFMPGFVPMEDRVKQNTEVGLLYVDHCVGNVGWNRMNEAVKW